MNPIDRSPAILSKNAPEFLAPLADTPYHRQRTVDHQDSVVAAFTVVVRHRVPLFTNDAIVTKFEGILRSEAEKFRCEALMYLFMPDRCSLLLQGNDGHAGLINVMRGFRSGAGYWLSRIQCNAKWHDTRGHHAHAINQDILSYARTLVLAPVQAGLATDWRQYRFKGSTLYTLESWL